ncbi:MAG: MATE family efflux transporter [Halolamina sp.]
MFDLSQEEITEGSIPRTLLLLAAPLVAQNMVQVVNAAVDIFWLGRLGEDAVAAVGLNFPLTALLSALILVAAVGTQVLVSQRTGAGDRERVRETVVHGTVLSFALTAVTAVAVVATAGSVVRLVGASGDVAALAAQYLVFYMLLFPFMAMSDTLEYAFIGVGDSRMALYVNLLAVGINVVLDPLLIFAAGLGVRGAALASGVGYTLGFVLSLTAAVAWRESLTLTRDSVGFDPATFREIAELGLPIGAQRVAGQSVRVLVVGIVVVVGGAPGLAAYTVGARIATISFVPASGLQQAAQSMIGQNLGADRPDRARRTTWIGVGIAAVGLSVIGLVQWFVPELLAGLFAPDLSPAGFALTIEYLRVLAYGYGAIGATYLLLAGFNGASRTKTSFVVDLAKYWGMRLPVAIAALPAGYAVSTFSLSVVVPGLDLGMSAIFWAVTGSNLVAAVAVGAYYYLETAHGGMLERAAERAAAD